MSEANREILSAGMDGELSREEVRFLLRRLEADPGLADAWSRYHAARGGLRRDPMPALSADFASRVMAAIEADASAMPGAAAPRRRWLQWSAGGAIAASVAVAALMLTQPGAQHPGAAPVAYAPAVETAPESVAAVSTPEPTSAPVAPQWLSGSTASQFTQKAAFDSSGDGGTAYLPRSTPYQIHRARAQANAPEANGVMLMIRPDGSRYVQPVAASQAR